MDRSISIIRRRPHLVDVLLPFVPTTNPTLIDRYRFKWASNFDGVFNGFLDAPQRGYLDDTIDIARLAPYNGASSRFVFDPTTYAIPDTTTFWIQVALLDVVGAETVVSAPFMVLPPFVSVQTLTIAGTAPATEIQLDLPRMMYDVSVVAEDDILLRFGENEQQMALYYDTGVSKLTVPGGISSVYVQGNGKTSPFSMSFTTSRS